MSKINGIQETTGGIMPYGKDYQADMLRSGYAFERHVLLQDSVAHLFVVEPGYYEVWSNRTGVRLVPCESQPGISFIIGKRDEDNHGQ